MCAVISPKVRIGCDRARHKSYIVFRMSYIARKEAKIEEIWDSKPTQTPLVESWCVMRKERVNSNGCEKVSTPNEQSESQ